MDSIKFVSSVLLFLCAGTAPLRAADGNPANSSKNDALAASPMVEQGEVGSNVQQLSRMFCKWADSALHMLLNDHDSRRHPNNSCTYFDITGLNRLNGCYTPLSNATVPCSDDVNRPTDYKHLFCDWKPWDYSKSYDARTKLDNTRPSPLAPDSSKSANACDRVKTNDNSAISSFKWETLLCNQNGLANPWAPYFELSWLQKSTNIATGENRPAAHTSKEKTN